MVTTEPGGPLLGLDDLLRPLGYCARLRQQNRSVHSRNADEIETHFDLTWKKSEFASPSVDFVIVVDRVCRTKSFELVSGGDHSASEGRRP